MSFTSITALEQVRLANMAENNALIEKIRKKNKGDPEFKDMQIVRYGDLVIAIHRPKKEALSGGAGTVYTAYPVQTDGTIDKDTPLVLKISKHTGRELKNEEEELKLTRETREFLRLPNGRSIDIQRIHTKLNENLVFETKNANRLAFSARVTTTSQQDKAGNTVYYQSILMSKVRGKSLEQLVKDKSIEGLSAEQRLRLALNVIRVYKELQAKGFYHRDIKAANIMIDLDTLQVMAIDLDNKVCSDTRAPEDTQSRTFIATAESDSFSLAMDVLVTILSGKQPTPREAEGFRNKGVINDRAIHALNTRYDSKVAGKIQFMLNGMLARNPIDRTTLAKAEEVILEQLEVVRGHSITEEEIQQEKKQNRKHKESLRTLDRVLSDPKYNHSDGYCELITELRIESANLAAEMIRDASQPEGAVKEDTVNKYNHIQQHIALLMGKSGYKSLTVSAETGVFQTEIVSVNNVSTNGSALEVDTEDQTEYLVKTLDHIRQTKADKAHQSSPDSELPAKVDQTHQSTLDSELPKPVRSFRGHNLCITIQEKAKRIDQFNQTFRPDLFGEIGTKFIESITKAVKTFSQAFSKAGGEASKNIHKFFSLKPPTIHPVTKPQQEGQSISRRKSTAQV